jgi:protoporphyrinogen oxidase
MRIGIVGGGILGLSLAHYLQRQGYEVEIFERNGYLGGLACAYDYEDFVWDKFYHVILPQDSHLLELLEDLGLSDEIRWRSTRTGLYRNGSFYSLSSTRDMLQFPLLGWSDKLRMGLGVVYGTRIANHADLYQMTAAEWLTKTFGARVYREFWSPLLRAKFGIYAEQVAAVSIHATLQRLARARSSVARRESMGYVRGGYNRILRAFRERIERRGGRLHLGARIHRICRSTERTRTGDALPAMEPAFVGAEPAHTAEVRLGAVRRPGPLEEAPSDGHPGVVVTYETDSNPAGRACFEKVFFTAPWQAADQVLSEDLKESAADGRLAEATGRKYLGVVCLAVVLRRPLTPFYVLNIADNHIPLTGMIEMTGVIDPKEETNGLSLVYLPRYVDSEDPFLSASDSCVHKELLSNGLGRLFPHLRTSDIVSSHVQRARYVQPLQLVTGNVPRPGNRLPDLQSPVVVANTACLACPTLNNDEVVGLAKEIAAYF